MHRVAPFAAAHHGVFDLRAARAVGISRSEIARARERDEITHLHHGVYRFRAAPATWEGDLVAACLAAGRRGFASHRAAAALHALPGGSRNGIEITCPRWRRSQRSGLVVHESTVWDSRDLTEIVGIPVAGPALTLLQVAAGPTAGALEAAVENALRRGLTSLAELDALLNRYARRGRPGIRRLRRLVRARTDATRPTDSERETFLVQLIRRHGLPDPVRQHVVRDEHGHKIATVDLAYPHARVAIEYDSDEFHTGRVATAADSSRRHALIAQGWLPVTAVSADLTSGGRVLCTALRRALDARSVVLTPTSAR